MVRENKKGFTMVELLAVIVILGILTVAAITGVTKIIDSAKVKYYTSSIKELKLAGQSYFQDNRSSLPKQNGRYTKVTLEKLQQKKYIDKVLDWDKKECKEKESYVNAIKRGTNDYQYVAFLKCKKEEDKIPNPKAPEVDIEFYANSSDEKKHPLQ